MVQEDKLSRGYYKRFRDEKEVVSTIRKEVGEGWITEDISSQISEKNTKFRAGRDFYRQSLSVFKNGLRMFAGYKILSSNTIDISFDLIKDDELVIEYVPIE